MSNFKNTTYVLLENDFDGDADAFRAWMEANHPEIDIDFRPRCSGVGGGLFDEFGEQVEDDLWGDYCNA